MKEGRKAWGKGRKTLEVEKKGGEKNAKEGERWVEKKKSDRKKLGSGKD